MRSVHAVERDRLRTDDSIKMHPRRPRELLGESSEGRFGPNAWAITSATTYLHWPASLTLLLEHCYKDLHVLELDFFSGSGRHWSQIRHALRMSQYPRQHGQRCLSEPFQQHSQLPGSWTTTTFRCIVSTFSYRRANAPSIPGDFAKKHSQQSLRRI